MDILVRAADLVIDKTSLIETMYQFLTPHSNEERFNWLYLENPVGQARAWIAVDRGRTGSVIGAASAFPRRLCMNGRRQLGWVLGDFCLDPRYRSLGPAVQLQRVFLSEVASGAMECFYDFPSASMMAVYRRLRIPEADTMVRLAKPLRVDRKVRELVTAPLIGRGISMAGNVLLRVADGVSSPASDIECELLQEPCGDEFTALDTRVAHQWGIHIERSAAYLNWRFLCNPILRHEMVIARSQKRLVGYAVFTHAGEDATLIDMFGETDSKVVRGILTTILSLLRGRNVVTISASLHNAHPWTKVLIEQGFRKRESVPTVLHWAPHLGRQLAGMDAANWWFVSGDRDS